MKNKPTYLKRLAFLFGLLLSLSADIFAQKGHTEEISVKPALLYFRFVNPEKPDVPLNKNDAFQKVQKRRVQEKR